MGGVGGRIFDGATFKKFIVFCMVRPASERPGFGLGGPRRGGTASQSFSRLESFQLVCWKLIGDDLPKNVVFPSAIFLPDIML
jgi:hypothetical protein